MPPNEILGLNSINKSLDNRIICGFMKTPIKHSKRRRRRRGRECIEENYKPPPAIITEIRMENPATTCSTSTTSPHITPPKIREISLEKSKLKTDLTLSLYRRTSSRRQKYSTLIFLVLFPLFISNTLAINANLPCDSNSWWDPVQDKCIQCTICEGEMIPLRPCQLHRDTICGSIYDLKIDWVVLAKTEPNWKERRKSDGTGYGLSALEHQLTHEELQQLHDDSFAPMDWQTAALFMAVVACLLFFIVAACILIHHMRQWRRMERRLDQDVEELSTKLMAKLAEVQNLDGGTFFIGNAEALQVPTRFQPQHVLLPADKSSKQHHLNHHHNHHQIRHEHQFLKTAQPGNVYIENGSKG